MFAVNNYEEIERQEREQNERHIIVLLFVRPGLPGAKEIIEEFSYLHHNAKGYCNIYAVGYCNDKCRASAGYKAVPGIDGAEWYYSDRAFVGFKNRLENRLHWKYGGEIELIVLQSNPEGRNILNFENYLAIDVNYGIRHEYIESFPRFMEALIRSSKKEVEALAAVKDVRKERLRLGDILRLSIDECKKVPAPVRKILKDRLFYRTSRSYS